MSQTLLNASLSSGSVNTRWKEGWYPRRCSSVETASAPLSPIKRIRSGCGIFYKARNCTEISLLEIGVNRRTLGPLSVRFPT